MSRTCNVTRLRYAVTLQVYVQLVTPYRVTHLQRYEVTLRGNVTSVYPPLDEASNVALPPSPTVSNPDNPQSPATPFLTAPRDKILTVTQYNFEGNLTRLNKGFHSKYQPIGFTTSRIKYGIACQISANTDYLNAQKFIEYTVGP